MKKILFRADAKPFIGTGDLVSFIHLSRYFSEQGWESHFAVKGQDTALALLKKYRISNKLIINDETEIQKEILLLNQYITKHSINAIFIQINEIGIKEYDGIKKGIFRACVYFKPGLPKDYNLVLSWDFDSDKYFKKADYPKTRFFLGPKYTIFPIDFKSNVIKKRKYKKQRKRLLITMGGADEFDFTRKAIYKLGDLNCPMDVKVILGPGYSNLERLKNSLRATKLKCRILQNTTQMFKEYMACDIALGSGGLTASELVVTRTPAFLVALYEHQINRCVYFNKMGWARCLGYRNLGNLALRDLETFTPKPGNRFDVRIGEVVSYMSKVCV